MKYCTQCGTQMDDDDLFCTNCGSKVSNEIEETKSQKISQDNQSPNNLNLVQEEGDYQNTPPKMEFFENRKNIIIIASAVLLIFVIILVIAISSNRGKRAEQSNPINETNDEYIDASGEIEDNIDYQEDIDFILERNIYVFNSEIPELYSEIINCQSSRGYIENWKFKDILNDSCYTNITWDRNVLSDDVTEVDFSGEYIDGSSKVDAVFLIQKGAKCPILWSIDLYSNISGENLHFDVEEIKKRGYSSDGNLAMFFTDAYGSILLSFASDECSEEIKSEDKDSAKESTNKVDESIDSTNNKSEIKNNPEAISKVDKVFSTILDGREEIEYDDDHNAGRVIQIYKEQPEDYNSNAKYAIAGSGFSPLYDTECIDYKDNKYIFYKKDSDTYYQLTVFEDEIDIYYSEKPSDFYNMVGCAFLTSNDESSYELADDEYVINAPEGYANLYSWATYDSNIYMQIPNGEIVKLTDDQGGDFVMVLYLGQIAGFIQRSNISK